jgi:hypothetical protein
MESEGDGDADGDGEEGEIGLILIKTTRSTFFPACLATRSI